MKIVYKALCYLFVSLLALPVMGQGLNTLDVVYLESGSVWQGTILSWEDDGVVMFETLNGVKISIPESQIKRVKQKVITDYKVVRPYSFKESGLYHSINLSASVGSEEPGLGATYSAGYRFNRLLGVGIGAGFENFSAGEGFKVIPLYAEIRGFVTRTKVSPYYALRAGYGFALASADHNIADAQGGWHVNPEVGVRFGGGSKVSYYLGIAAHFQEATYEYDWPFSEGSTTDRYLFKRWEMKMGITF